MEDEKKPRKPQLEGFVVSGDNSSKTQKKETQMSFTFGFALPFWFVLSFSLLRNKGKLNNVVMKVFFNSFFQRGLQII